MRQELESAFERALDAIAHDSAFAQLEVLQHTAKPKHGSIAFTVTIDRPGGADLVLCERVAARINAGLEELDASYELQVESAGLDRPLTKLADYERFKGMRARIVTSLLVHGAKTHRGILRGLQGQNVLLETRSGRLPLPIATIKSANLEYDTRADLQREKKQRKGTHGRNGN
ncbi:MAG: hypothetical protein ACYC8W_07195 [Candidatus Tyrphobacter sp.]